MWRLAVVPTLASVLLIKLLLIHCKLFSLLACCSKFLLDKQEEVFPEYGLDRVVTLWKCFGLISFKLAYL